MMGGVTENNSKWSPAFDGLMKKKDRCATDEDVLRSFTNAISSTRRILATSMDGPSVPWTVNDLFQFNNRVFLTYHCISAGCDLFTPLGGLVGAFVLPRTTKFSHLTTLQAVGTGSAMGAGLGLSLGLFALIGTAYSKNLTIPFDEEGIEQRVNGLKHNYGVRAMDLGVWIGTATAGGTMLLAGGPTRFGLSMAPLGHIQGLALGAMTGLVVSNVVVQVTK